MPLKHTTETLLVFLLAAVIALTGIAVATLPSLNEGGIRAWGVLLILTLLYPIILLPLFRRDRADHAFRLLHWFPFLMLIIWLVLQLIVRSLPASQGLTDAYTWGWTLPVVAIGFVLLAAFCLQVLRRWVPRLALLALAFVPFAFLAVLNEQRFHWDDELTAMLWVKDDEGTPATGSGSERSQIAVNVSSANLAPSSDESEEEWRERLRALERRRERIAERLKNDDEGSSSMPSVASSVGTSRMAVSASSLGTAGTSASVRAVLSLASLSSKTSSASTSSTSVASSRGLVAVTSEGSAPLSGTGKELREAKTQPGRLPMSGFGTGGVAVSLLAGYCSVLHKRAVKRLQHA